MTDTTKSIRKKAMIFQIISAALDFGPLLVYLIIAFAQSTTTEKVVISFMSLLSIGLCIVNLLFKYSFRSTVWLLLIAIYIALDNIIPLLIIVTICTLADEFAITPLYKEYKNKYKINKEIDARE